MSAIDVRADEVAVGEQAELDHRRLDPQLDEDEGGQHQDGAGEQREDRRRAPAPGVALDQRQYQRGQAAVRVATPA